MTLNQISVNSSQKCLITNTNLRAFSRKFGTNAFPLATQTRQTTTITALNSLLAHAPVLVSLIYLIRSYILSICLTTALQLQATFHKKNSKEAHYTDILIFTAPFTQHLKALGIICILHPTAPRPPSHLTSELGSATVLNLHFELYDDRGYCFLRMGTK